jgi:hypothetical protein
MYDDGELTFERRLELLEYSHEGRQAAARLREQAREAEQGDATFAARRGISPDSYRIGLTDGCALGLNWRGRTIARAGSTCRRPPTTHGWGVPRR